MATRLRVHLKDNSKANIEKLKNIQLSKGFNIAGDQYQLIFGTGTVNKVYDNLNNFVSLSSSAKNFGSTPSEKKSYWNKELKFYSNLFLLNFIAIYFY